jgi:hypothetical protein
LTLVAQYTSKLIESEQFGRLETFCLSLLHKKEKNDDKSHLVKNLIDLDIENERKNIHDHEKANIFQKYVLPILKQSSRPEIKNIISITQYALSKPV